MWRWILLAVLLIPSVTCSRVIAMRNVATYGMEIGYIGRVAKEAASALERRIQESCRCMRYGDALEWSESLCQKDAELVQLMRVRLPYHFDLMLYQAKLEPNRPPRDAPEVPNSTDLCPQ